ncbi:hypothetical protein OE88DRAFT_1562020 [Heliocybe sulcata]|uniref:Uncharacterized protein n=1 Tax=Heliocybe sulcata TaxID=5364 RepID=A0A5C3N2Y3_9AGAM|nr:hypothetical protein OE88DRAFT_1562020 [Heliocybe sulcata]
MSLHCSRRMDFPNRGRFEKTFVSASLSCETPAECQQQLSEGQRVLQDIAEEIQSCKAIFSEARRKRLELARQASLSGPSEEYSALVSECHKIRKHLIGLLKDQAEKSIYYETESGYATTGYRGLVDWAETMLGRHSHLSNVLAQLSLAGAALTYSTIFSATRGSVGHMSLAFAFFNFGFVIPMVSQALLKWAARRDRKSKLLRPMLWSLVLCFFIYVSVIVVAAAICILSLTIFYLQFPLGSDGRRGDSPLQFDNLPRFGAGFMFICAGLSAVVTGTALIIHYIHNGWTKLFYDLCGYRDVGTDPRRHLVLPL